MKITGYSDCQILISGIESIQSKDQIEWKNKGGLLFKIIS